MQRDELAAWLRLTHTRGVGQRAVRRLLAAFGLPQHIFSQGMQAWKTCLTTAQAHALAAKDTALDDLIERTWQWLQPQDSAPNPLRRAIVTLGDAAYPPALLATDDPPPLLYLLGAPHYLNESQPFAPAHCLAMVGSRTPTAQGTEHAWQFARALRSAGLCIVSGLALGIDAAAHEGALADVPEHAVLEQPATIAIIGTGLDRVYPAAHKALAHRIARNGLLVSEFPLGTPPLPGNFPKRNRIIAGLSQGTLVVEAAPQSGSLITARLAAEQGREVFAIPGSIHAPQSRGCHALIRQGAKLVETAQDVLEELPPLPVTPTPMLATADNHPSPREALIHSSGQAGFAVLDPVQGANHRRSGATSRICNAAMRQNPHMAAARGMDQRFPRPEDAVLQALGFDPVGIDTLCARCGMDAAALQVRLLELELEGRVARLPGGLFQRVGCA